jgi:phosphoserine phosphatase
MKRKFAVFDIDGTYLRAHLYWSVMLALAKEKKLPRDVNSLALGLYEDWKNRKNDRAFEEFDRTIVTRLNDLLHEIKPDDFDSAIRNTLAKTLDQVYMYPKSLKEKLQAEGYFIIAISGSHQEEVELFCRHHGFDDWAGQVWHRSDDGKTFTGDQTFTHNNKDNLLKSFVKKHDLTYEGSYGVGDTSTDIPMLELVENPIAFNPNPGLLEHAQEQNWKVVIERKSIAYTLTRGASGNYELEG